VIAPYHWLLGADGAPDVSLNRERLIRRQSGDRWEARVHESVPVSVERAVFVPDLVVEHQPGPDRRIRNL